MDEPIEIVSVHRPTITLDYRMDGGVDIRLDDFVYVSINYDYRYTDNATRHALAQRIADLIGGKTP